MKLEKPPKTGNLNDLHESYINRKYADFLKITDEKYPYWDDLKYKKGLPFEDPLKVWSLIKLHRRLNYHALTFGHTEFNFFLTEDIQRSIHEFDLKLIGGLYQHPITPYDEIEYLKSSILEEAIASSQMEGAATTTKVAIDMLKSGREPRGESEQMIFNNLRGINFIKEELDSPIDFKFIIELHQIMTANTKAEYCSGNFRNEQIYVQDYIDGEIAHTPPTSDEVENYMADLVSFVNEEDDFIHPIIKASIIHFIFAYIHPFMDGNGRTARALFYWYLMKKDYSLMKAISISRTILDSRIQYDKAFLKTEYDENDMTYFINYSIKTLKLAFEKLIHYRDKKKKEQEAAELIAYKLIKKGLSTRQADLVAYLYTEEDRHITMTTFGDKHQIVRQTARRDLNELITIGLIEEKKSGREIFFTLKSHKAVEKYIKN
ncbi:Fic family protein [Prolixibacteraceae bacterium]|nr:Fic family protein [Prolixibacteraceae bacterium]